MTSSRRSRPSLASDLFELLSSMRFAIGLLTILAIASVIGTVLRQNEPWPNYVAEFGSFWFEVYRALGLFDVYHSAWFLVILIFLVLSIVVGLISSISPASRALRQPVLDAVASE